MSEKRDNSFEIYKTLLAQQQVDKPFNAGGLVLLSIQLASIFNDVYENPEKFQKEMQEAIERQKKIEEELSKPAPKPEIPERPEMPERPEIPERSEPVTYYAEDKTAR